jgi:hypothetical protein
VTAILGYTSGDSMTYTYYYFAMRNTRVVRDIFGVENVPRTLGVCANCPAPLKSPCTPCLRVTFVRLSAPRRWQIVRRH